MDSGIDAESAEWLAALTGDAFERETAAGRLHEMLLRVTAAEARRRGFQLGIQGPELDDLAHQAAADAVMAILKKVDQFRGESRFTTWAYKFAVLEVSSKIGRHGWRNRTVHLEAEDWDRLPGRFGMRAEHEAEWHDLVLEIRRVVETELTDHQRKVFVAIVLDDVPLDALAVELGSNRNALYKTLFDARRKLRAVLVANGYLESDVARDA